MEEIKTTTEKTKWYHSTTTLVIALLSVGPFALPLIWVNPKFSLTKKVLWTAVTVILTYVLVQVAMDSVDKIMKYYKEAGLPL